MLPEGVKREKLVKFIRSNDPSYLFSNLDEHSMEQLEKMKKDIDLEIKTRAKRGT